MSGRWAWVEREALGVGPVGREEPQRRRPARHAGSIEHVAQEHAFPVHVGHDPARYALELMDQFGPFHGPEVGETEAQRFADHAVNGELVGVGRNDRVGAGDGVVAELVVSGQRDADGIADRAGDVPESVVDLGSDRDADTCQSEDPEHGSSAHVDRFGSWIATTRRLIKLIGHRTPPLAIGTATPYRPRSPRVRYIVGSVPAISTAAGDRGIVGRRRRDASTEPAMTSGNPRPSPIVNGSPSSTTPRTRATAGFT